MIDFHRLGMPGLALARGPMAIETCRDTSNYQGDKILEMTSSNDFRPFFLFHLELRC